MHVYNNLGVLRFGCQEAAVVASRYTEGHAYYTNIILLFQAEIAIAGSLPTCGHLCMQKVRL